MIQPKIAKIFRNGASQAVRLPAEFRFDSDQVYIYRDEKTQNVVLSTKPGTEVWDKFLKKARSVDIPQDWMKDRPMNRVSTEDRLLFNEED